MGSPLRTTTMTGSKRSSAPRKPEAAHFILRKGEVGRSLGLTVPVLDLHARTPEGVAPHSAPNSWQGPAPHPTHLYVLAKYASSSSLARGPARLGAQTCVLPETALAHAHTRPTADTMELQHREQAHAASASAHKPGPRSHAAVCRLEGTA